MAAPRPDGPSSSSEELGFNLFLREASLFLREEWKPIFSLGPPSRRKCHTSKRNLNEMLTAEVSIHVRMLTSAVSISFSFSVPQERARTMLASSEATAAREREFYRSARAVVCLRMCTFLFVAVAMRWVTPWVQSNRLRTRMQRTAMQRTVPAPAAPAMP